jgi:hypothetical protein
MNGHLDVARWLVIVFGLTEVDARSRSNNALRGACENGNLAIACWLTTTFGLTAADTRDNHTLRYACASGHLGVARWLIAAFGSTAADTHPLGNSSLFWDRESGRTAEVHWLAAAFSE